MHGRIALLACVLACGCDVVFRVDHIEGDNVSVDSDATPTGIKYVQGAGQALGGVTMHALAFPAPVQAGDLVVVAVTVFRGTLIGLADSVGNAYMQPQAGLETDGLSRLHIFFAPSVVGADQLIVTATATGAVDTEISMAIHEYSGAAAAPLDKHTMMSGHSGTPVILGPVESTVDGELYFAAMTHDNTNTTTPGPGYTIRQRPTESNVGVTPLVTEDMIGTQGLITAEFGLATSSSWVGALFTFR